MTDTIPQEDKGGMTKWQRFLQRLKEAGEEVSVATRANNPPRRIVLGGLDTLQKEIDSQGSVEQQGESEGHATSDLKEPNA